MRRFLSGDSVLYCPEHCVPLEHDAESPRRNAENVHTRSTRFRNSSHPRWSSTAKHCLRELASGIPGLSRLLPSPAREIWELHRGASLCDRHLAEWSGRAYGRRVVHVHIGRESFTHALHQAINHYEVHPAVTAPLASQLADVLPERVLVLRFVLFKIRPLLAAFLAIEVQPRRVVAKNSLCP